MCLQPPSRLFTQPGAAKKRCWGFHHDNNLPIFVYLTRVGLGYRAEPACSCV